MELKDKKVLVIGAGKSGIAAARFLLAKGAWVTLSDSNGAKGAELPVTELTSEGLVLSLGEYPVVGEGNYDLLVVSPGVPLAIEPVRVAKEVGIPVVGEVELAFSFAKAPVVAITGTNGKTTTTTLIGEIFKNAGFSTLVAGNIGRPLIEEIEGYDNGGIIVAEVSSFQLESTLTFRPKVAAILNITPDHLDRHGTMAGYIEAKARVFREQGPDDYTILNYDDPETAKLAAGCPGKVIFFSRQNSLDCGVFLADGKIVSVFNNTHSEIISARDLGIPGPHNLENALAAVAAALVFGVAPMQIATTLKSFSGVEHRLEFVRELNGVRYINDSKGTNPDASIKALESFIEPIILLAGGKNKGNDFKSFAEKIKEKARFVVTLGQCAGEIEDALRAVGFHNYHRAAGFKDAVLEASGNANPGEAVLLSPACASWDMFNSFEERGELFKKVVNNLG